MKNSIFILFFCCFSLFLSLESVFALEHVRFSHKGKERSREGRLVHEDAAYIYLETREGQFFIIERKDIITRVTDDIPFVPYTKAEMIERLKEEFPPAQGYNYLDMYGPFIVIYTTSRPFANWYGNLLEHLHRQYVSFWKKNGVSLTTPDFPLVAFVLSSEEQFRQYAKQEGDNVLPNQIAYYHRLKNRIVIYDISGQQEFQGNNQRRATYADIQRLLAHPSSYRNIMLAVHEAVHQVGFNTGMHPRYALNPTWIHEGLATLHEVPDRRNTRLGWTLGPHVNTRHLERLRVFLNTPQQEAPIQRMIKEDKLFDQQATALDNYALSWGVTYFLVRRRTKELTAYLTLLQAKTSDSDDTAEIRIQDFESCFGDDWEKFYADFYNFLKRL